MTSSLHDDALVALIDGRQGEAGAILSGLLHRDGDDHRAWFLKGRLAGLQGRFDDERDFTARAVALRPDHAEYLAQLGKCHARRQDLALALDCADRALACDELSDLALDAVAAIHTRFGFHARAAVVLRRAAELGTCNAAIHFNLGTSLKFCGDFAGARTAFERAIALAPGYSKAHAALSSLGGVTAGDNHIDRLVALMAQTCDDTERLHLSHAAAREYEALGRYDDAFACLHAAKSAFIRGHGGDSGQDRRLFNALQNAFAETAQVAGYDDARPLFITGMPRSGTTVLDRVLSNHPAVTSIGETQHFSNLLKQQAGVLSRAVADDLTVRRMAAVSDLSQIGRAYMARGLALSGGQRFVDKFHLNILVAGFIARALPQARILCLVRDPLDTVVSNYRQLFELASPIYRYSLDLGATARFHAGFRQLADMWARLFPDQFHIVRYETLVSDPEPAIRSILNVCGLDWQERCLHIETNDSAVATASAVQVRQPINARSVGNWRRYAAHLDEVRAILSRAGVTVD